MKRKLLLSMMLMFLLVSSAWAQRTITGTVTSADGALPGATVQVKGTQQGTQTDIEGKYSITVPEGTETLVYRFVGYKTVEETIGNRTVIDVTMIDGVLESVVVVGYGEQSERFSTQTVSTVTGTALAEQPVTSVQDALQGQAAGVQMTGASGVIGSQPNIRIRGVTSITSGSSPLYVVDGVPLNDAEGTTLEGGYSNLLGGGTATNPLIEINPQDIESVTILKDASATAIYGSRGANGVIVITTKKGKANQKTMFNADVYTGWVTPVAINETMNRDQYAEYRNAVRVGLGAAPIDFPEGNFDWVDAVLRTGTTSNYSLSATGGTEKTQFYVGGTYFRQSAYVIGNDLERLSGRVNVSHNATDKLRFGVNLNLVTTDNDRISSDNSTFAPLTSSYLQSPFVQPRDENGAYVNTGFIANVLAIEELSTRYLKTRRTIGNIYAEYDIIPNLKVRTSFGTDLVYAKEKIRDVEIVSPGGYAYRRDIQDNKWLNTTTVDYSKSTGDHSFNALLGFSYETSRLETMAVEGSGFVTDGFPNVGNAATPTITSETGSQWALESQFLRLNYRYNDRYLAEATVRRDGSSRFGANNRYGIFWAVSGGWILSEESFLNDIEALDILKLSVSYGTTGNDRVGNFASLGLYQGGVNSDYAGFPGIRPTQAANPDLSWEETTQLDVTVSFGFLKRFSGQVSYYNKVTDGILLDVPLPYTSGFASIIQNVGKMGNSGIDLSLTSTNIETASGFKWVTSLNAGYVKNEVLSLPADNQDPEGRNILTATSYQRAIEGYSLNTYYMIKYKGINPETGDAEWFTKDGEVTTTPTPDDRVIVGSAIPEWTGGLRNTFTYKGLSLDALFNFSIGSYVYLDEFTFLNNPTSSFNKTTELLNVWENPGDNAYAPAYTSATNLTFAQESTQQLANANFLRLRTLTLAYDLPKNILAKTKTITRARVYVRGQNLLTVTSKDFFGADPEVNRDGTDGQLQGASFFTPPQGQALTIGANFSF
ncbi:SusC/RagA family TonB-linked outer membrane protein [Bernardetia sp. OM2101]|uniref:SusC/RagA family TonB-linked outer membrane protein n=1 Tax=Bernardetia sp. OM2101 TaxID=3344876 RepID=UPI0035CF56C1